jgi:hypothetical protein
MPVTPMFAMRLPVPIREALGKAAKADMRTESQMAIKILADYLKSEGFLREVPKPGKPGKKGKR